MHKHYRLFGLTTACFVSLPVVLSHFRLFCLNIGCFVSLPVVSSLYVCSLYALRTCTGCKLTLPAVLSHFQLFCFVCVEVLRPSQPNGVMSSAVSLPNHTITGQA